MIRGVLFDMDGTLHDTEVLFFAAWRKAAEELRVPDIEATLRDCTGRNRRDMAVYWTAKYGNNPAFEQFYQSRQKYFHEMIQYSIPVKAGAYTLLDYLKNRGYLLGLVTSTGTDAALEHMERTRMLSYFDVWVTGDRVRRGKPAPDGYLQAAYELGLKPNQCIGVEDSLNGVRSIHAAGMRPVMVRDLCPPTPEIRNLLWAECTALDDLIPVLTHGVF